MSRKIVQRLAGLDANQGLDAALIPPLPVMDHFPDTRSQTPTASNFAEARPAQSRFAAGLAGLGWGRVAIRIESSGKTRRAQASANAPIPINHSGFKIPTTSRRCWSQTEKSFCFSIIGNLSGVRFAPPSSRKARGQ